MSETSTATVSRAGPRTAAFERRARAAQPREHGQRPQVDLRIAWVPQATIAPERTIPHGLSKAGTNWTHHLVAYALDRFHRQHLRTPTLREFRAGIPDLPSHGTIKRLYGSTGKMLRHHGYAVRSPGAQPGHPCTLERGASGRFLPRAGEASGPV